ncbi:MAG: hypothetical protein QMD86_00555 [Patescibacteria group bacterium]|nr:hypothetical protein [Patescibacteria group bacterium]
MIKTIIKFFDKLEDKVREKLSRKPILYALVGSIGIILLWRGVWHLADDVGMSSWISVISGILILLLIGLFVSFFVGEQTIISGIKAERKIDEKTEEEIKKEAITLEELHEDIEEIKDKIGIQKNKENK